MRQRLTNRKSSRSLAAEIREVERMIQASEDAELEKDTSEIERHDDKVISEGIEGPIKPPGDQNKKMENNWPTTASDREKLAGKLLYIAKQLLKV